MVEAKTRLYVKVTRENLPQIKSRYPYLYLERGRLEIDDSSIKWIDATGAVIPIPAACISTLLLGPGTSVTHDAVRTAAAANCSICWVGEDSLLFYATGVSPTSNTRNLKRQVSLAASPEKSLKVARRMFQKRFPGEDLKAKTLIEMMGMEGYRVRAIYEAKAKEYGVGWKGREFVPGKFSMGDVTNQALTACNAALYGIVCSNIHALGYSPHIGFIHSGSPLPFVYDVSDLYKETLCIDLAFDLTLKMAGRYNKHVVSEAFRSRVLESDLLGRIPNDIHGLFERA